MSRCRPAQMEQYRFVDVQGSATTTITIDPAAGSAGTTTIVTITAVTGAGTQVINGVPQQYSSAGVSTGDAIDAFCRWATMFSFRQNFRPGPGRHSECYSADRSGFGQQQHYRHGRHPFSDRTGDQVTGTVSTIDQLIPANNTGYLLASSRRLATCSWRIPNPTVIWRSMLRSRRSLQTGSGGIVNTGASINTLTIVGGRIQNTIQSIGATTRNVLFDCASRTASCTVSGAFPATTVTPKAGVGGAAVVTWKGAAVAEPDQLPTIWPLSINPSGISTKRDAEKSASLFLSEQESAVTRRESCVGHS